MAVVDLSTAPSQPWTDHDSAVWHTCDIASRLLGDGLDKRPAVPSPFPPQLAEGERLLVEGAYDLSTYRPVGDGSHTPSSGVFLATGRTGLALTAGFAVVRAAGNRRRAEHAWQDAQPRWVVDERGALWVSTAGFYLHTPNGLRPTPWRSVRAATLAGPGAVQLHLTSRDGEQSWLIQSWWAELMFVLWALAVHPGHPTLQAGAWLPPGWRERCLSAGYGSQLPSGPAADSVIGRLA